MVKLSHLLSMESSNWLSNLSDKSLAVLWASLLTARHDVPSSSCIFRPLACHPISTEARFFRCVWVRLVTQLCLTDCDLMDCSLSGFFVHRDSPVKNTEVGCHALLHGIFPTQGLNPGLPHCRQILYCLSHQGSPQILEWVSLSLCRGTSQPRNQTRVSCIAGGFFTSWAIWEAFF